MNVSNENTLRSALTDGFNLFLGAGFSVLARNARGQTMPVGNQLPLELGEVFGVAGADRLNLSQICTIIRSTRSLELDAFFGDRFRIENYDERYEHIEKLNIKSIFTTNIDNLVFRIFEESPTRFINDITIRGPAHGDRQAIDFAPLHGSIVHGTGEFIFSDMEIASAFAMDTDKWHFLTRRIQEYPTLFWGYSLRDGSVLQALSPKSVAGRPHKEKWIVLHQSDPTERSYFEALDFNIIVAETSEMLDYIRALKIEISRGRFPSQRSTAQLFPEESIPDAGRVPVRPLLDFFTGSPPMWNDIFSNGIPRTSHYAKIVDLINSGKNVIVVGIPACGKTTLLMQIAAGITFRGHKLVCEPLTSAKAALILRKLGTESALIFVDDYCDDVESFEMLVRAPNVVAIGFDRDHNFGITSHLIDSTLYEIVDVTNLTDRDIQSIYDHIPLGIRLQTLLRPSTEGDISPSLYEVIETNSREPRLRSRYGSMLSRLEADDLLLHDLLVMCCYVHSCRTPVSIDMIAAFLRGDISDYTDALIMVERLGAMIAEYSGTLVDADQDYFTPRSTLVSEAILFQAEQRALKRVLTRFHSNISRLRICRFDIFRRKAYDADLAMRAFSNWTDGLGFYEMVSRRDDSAFVKQQAAIYLSKKHRYREAFQWIDSALLQSRNRIFSIRNSHAIILFQANINQDPEDPTVRDTLTRSMDILRQCYSDDKRKLFHAITYADQALRLSEVYDKDSGVHDHLIRADQWLGEEERRSPWNRDVKRFRRRVKSVLLGGVP